MARPSLDSFVGTKPIASSTRPNLDSFVSTPSTTQDAPIIRRSAGQSILPNSTLSDNLKAIPGQLLQVGKNIGSFLTGSEQKFGENIAAAVGAQEAQANNDEQMAQEHKNIELAVQARNKLRAQGHDTSQVDEQLHQLIANTGQGSKVTDVLPGANDTPGQIAGNAAGVGLDIASLGTLSMSAKSFTLAKAIPQATKPIATSLSQVGKNYLTNAAKYGTLGYGYDVAGNLQEGKTGSEAATPGLTTVLGATLPGLPAAMQASKVIAKDAAPRLINSLVKPLLKDFAYGKDPGMAIAKEGLIGNSLEDLGKNVETRKNQVGQEIGALSSSLDQKAQAARLPGGAQVDLSKTLESIDAAMQKAAQDNSPSLLKRLQDVKIALTHDLSMGTDEAGSATIEKGAAKDLLRSTFSDAFAMKTRVGDITQWTGNASDDKAVNGALKGVYGGIKDAINTKVEQVDPHSALKLKALNERYANLTTADVAIKYRDKINARQNIISAPIKAGAVAALVAAPFTGGISLGTMLIALGAAGAEKALGSTAVKSRVAAWLAKESPSAVERFSAAHPQLASTIRKAFSDVVVPGNDQRGFIKTGLAPEVQQAFKGIKPEDIYFLKDAANSVAQGDKLPPNIWQGVQEIFANRGMETPSTQHKFLDYFSQLHANINKIYEQNLSKAEQQSSNPALRKAIPTQGRTSQGRFDFLKFLR